jgi:hypothetical protein
MELLDMEYRSMFVEENGAKKAAIDDDNSSDGTASS